MISLIRLYFQNDTSVNSDQLRVDFHPRLTLGFSLHYCDKGQTIFVVSRSRGNVIFLDKFQFLCVTILMIFTSLVISVLGNYTVHRYISN